MPMVYRLGFTRTPDGYLRVTACAAGATLTAVHLNPSVLVAAADVAKVPKHHLRDIQFAAETAWRREDLDICCETVSLDSDQLDKLGFLRNWPTKG
ncbi:hypothetical protein HDF11_004751 [Tunturiibacter psychrotolerans]